MASKQLASTLDKLNAYLQKTRGSFANVKAVGIMHDLVAIQKHVQDSNGNLTNVAEVQRYIGKIKEALGIEDWNNAMPVA